LSKDGILNSRRELGMKTKMMKLVVMLVMLLVVMVNPVLADRYSVALTTEQFNTESAGIKGLGDYYLVKVEVPNIVKSRELLRVTLAISLDVSAREFNGYINEAPVLEGYALTGTMENGLEPEKFEVDSPMRRNVALGTERHIRIDITSAVMKFMDDPSKNHGLVVGSLTNQREGIFQIKSVGEVKATIIYYFIASE
jgi:hypothetical protein